MELSDGVKFLNETEKRSKRSGNSMSSEDEPNVYTESMSDFRLDPIEFEEVTSQVMERVDDVFDLTTRCNRFAPQFLTHCAELQAGIRYLAGAALTKTAFQDQHQEFPKLSQLSLNKLYMMTSWTFRKINAALDEQKQKTGTVTPGLWRAMLRTLSLLRRLKASEEKVYKHWWMENWSSDRVTREKMLTPESSSRVFSRGDEETPVFRQSPAFSPLQGTAETVREMKNEEGRRKAEEPSTELPCGVGGGRPEMMNKEGRRKAEELPRGVGGGRPEDEVQKVTFTVDQMRALLLDPQFLIYEPKLAEIFRRILARVDSS